MKNYILLSILVFLVFSTSFGQNDNTGKCDTYSEMDICKDNEYTMPLIMGDNIEVLKNLFNDNLPVDIICKEINQKRIAFQLIIDAKGMVTKVVLPRSTGCKLLDKEITRIIKLVPFDPAKCGFEPICSSYMQVVDLDTIMELPK